MSEIPITLPKTNNTTQTFTRRACLADFFDEDEDKNTQNTKNKHNKNYSHNDSIIIAKNQQEFGQRKRIKP